MSKSLFKLMKACCKIDSWDKISVKFESEKSNFINQILWEYSLTDGGHSVSA